MERVERRFAALADDFDGLQDRFTRFQGRQVKRAALDAREEDPSPPPERPGVDPISARIISMRHRRKAGPGGAR